MRRPDAGARRPIIDRLNPYIIVFVGAGLGGVLRHVLNNACRMLGADFPGGR